MSGNTSMKRGEIDRDILSNVSETPGLRTVVRAGVTAGLSAGVIIWIYEALVWVGAQHLLPLAGIPRNATGLVFGKEFQESIGIWAYFLGTGIHFFFASAWGILFAAIWPYFRRRGYEATFVALFYAIVAWIVMHVAIMIRKEAGRDRLYLQRPHHVVLLRPLFRVRTRHRQ